MSVPQHIADTSTYLPPEIWAQIIENIHIGSYEHAYNRRVVTDAFEGSKWVAAYSTLRLVSRTFRHLTETFFALRLIRSLQFLSQTHVNISRRVPDDSPDAPDGMMLRSWFPFRLWWTYARMSDDGQRVVLREWAAFEHREKPALRARFEEAYRSEVARPGNPLSGQRMLDKISDYNDEVVASLELALSAYRIAILGDVACNVEFPELEYHCDEARGIYELSFRWRPMLDDIIAEERYRRTLLADHQLPSIDAADRAGQTYLDQEEEVIEIARIRREVGIRARYVGLKRWEERNGVRGVADIVLEEGDLRDAYEHLDECAELVRPDYLGWREWVWGRRHRDKDPALPWL